MFRAACASSVMGDHASLGLRWTAGESAVVGVARARGTRFSTRMARFGIGGAWFYAMGGESRAAKGQY